MAYITHNENIDLILNSYKAELGGSYEQYRNHVYRVFNFALQSVTDKTDINTLSIAAAFHDLGIWTNKTFDYIQPSIVLAKCYCEKYSINPLTSAEIGLIIGDHHKLTRIKKSRLAEIFRQADLTDLTWGLIRNRIDKKDIRKIKHIFPNKGFHASLCRLFLKNLMRKPFKPLPMYKF